MVVICVVVNSFVGLLARLLVCLLVSSSGRFCLKVCTCLFHRPCECNTPASRALETNVYYSRFGHVRHLSSSASVLCNFLILAIRQLCGSSCGYGTLVVCMHAKSQRFIIQGSAVNPVCRMIFVSAGAYCAYPIDVHEHNSACLMARMPFYRLPFLARSIFWIRALGRRTCSRCIRVCMSCHFFGFPTMWRLHTSYAHFAT